ncbi:DUF4932 domain-containing protein [Pseudoflavitalea rhizosphaerae]|uniref:DUF4932 domain-containing protein n=1 Tax=Pseudoflavitalea rhizosphaerae TaxID=1884793 RepID=UPI000F8CEAF5|nr:DUF4932 domain-containing protein [Pseudoflavitalea rhizosphaerae]
MPKQFYLTVIFLSALLSTARSQGTLTVRVDPRFEAISIFYFLATADTFDLPYRPTPSIYYGEVKRYFEKFKFHPSLEWYRKLDRWDGFDIPSLGTYLSHSVPYMVTDSIENDYVRSAPADTFLSRMNAFALDTRIHRFIRRHRRFYAWISQSVEDSLRQSRILETAHNFFGSDELRQTVVMIDLLNNQGNNAIPSNNPKYRGQCHIRLAYLSDTSEHRTNSNRVVFHPRLNVVLHEMTHIYLHDFITDWNQRLYPIRSMFLQTAKGDTLKEDEWRNELDELLVRVCVAVMLAEREGSAAGEKEIRAQARHYKWALPLYELMKQYTSSRNQYTRIKDFYPVLVKFFEQRGQQKQKTQ